MVDKKGLCESGSLAVAGLGGFGRRGGGASGGMEAECFVCAGNFVGQWGMDMFVLPSHCVFKGGASRSTRKQEFEKCACLDFGKMRCCPYFGPGITICASKRRGA